jgi:hypothetical protein
LSELSGVLTPSVGQLGTQLLKPIWKYRTGFTKLERYRVEGREVSAVQLLLDLVQGSIDLAPGWARGEAPPGYAWERKGGVRGGRPGSGRLPEQLIKGLDTGDKGTLNDRIGRLDGRVSTGLFQMLDVVRFTGNEVLHEGEAGELVAIALDDEVGPALIETFLDCANRLVDELITRPAQDRQLWEKLPQSIMESIQRRSERRV